MCPFSILCKSRQEAASGDGTSPASTNIGYIGKITVQLFLIFIVHGQLPCLILRIVCCGQNFFSQFVIMLDIMEIFLNSKGYRFLRLDGKKDRAKGGV